MVVAPKLAPTEATRRWAALLRQVFAVDRSGARTAPGPMRIVACITQAAVTDQILPHRRTRPTAGARPGSLVGAVRCAKRSQIGPDRWGNDLRRGRPGDPRRRPTSPRPPEPHAGASRGVQSLAIRPQP